DLAVGPASGGVRLYLNAGRGLFMDAEELCELPVPADLEVRLLVAADLTADGAPDLFAAGAGRSPVVLENRWHRRPDIAYLVVRPRGARGVLGSIVRLRDSGTQDVLASSPCPPCAVCPAECCFGVRFLPRAVVEVLFSDGAARPVEWARAAAGEGPLSVARP
ncbi:MAG: hypothetical protein AMK73_08095, partial [Planctomycetes bacterium SM23_32]